MRHRWSLVIVVLALALSIAPAAADTRLIDPTEEPEITLSEAEAQKLAALQSAVFPTIVGDVSPDDATIFTAAYTPSGVLLQFVNINDATTVNVDDVALALGPLVEPGWLDEHTVRYISLNENLNPVIVDIDSRTGAVSAAEFDLPGFPISLSPNAARVFIALVEETEEEEAPPEEGEGGSGTERVELKALSRGPFKLDVESPFNVRIKRSLLDQRKPGLFETGQSDLMISEVRTTLAVFDLNSGILTPLTDLPENSGLASPPMWTRDGSKLAYARLTIPNIGRSGTPLSDWATQDGLGLLPPAENPFVQGSVVDTFDFNAGDYRPAALSAANGNGDIFSYAAWSPDGQTLLTQLSRPARLTGRPNPVYLTPESSYFRFYNAELQPIQSFDRIETSASFSVLPLWASNDELFFRSVYGLSYRLYYYNRISGEFRQVSTDDGTYDQVRATRQSRLLIFNHASFQKPYDLYRLQWDGQALAGLTFFNYGLAELNQVRADVVSFRLRGGATRVGFLVQPAGAAFPPRNVPIVVWQEGGPGPAMTSAWGANVENPYNLLPNFGIAVLVVPLPGRVGWGPQFYNDLANGRNFGQIDVDEQAEIVEQMIRRGYTSRGNVGIAGCSYGGYFTTQSITRHPGLYAAANTQCTLLDIYSEFQFGYTPVVAYLEGRSPTIDPNEYAKDSPLFNVDRVRTPTLMFHGTEDFLPMQLVVNFHDQIDANDVPVELLQFGGEGHGLGAATSQFVAGQAQIEWFRTYLAAARTSAAARR
jgi:dipeptidyl aminopeptidase/acylaminoacyl peptidase